MFLPYFCTPFEKRVIDLVAQLVEQYTFNVWALGSSPSQITKKNPQYCRGFFNAIKKLYFNYPPGLSHL